MPTPCPPASITRPPISWRSSTPIFRTPGRRAGDDRQGEGGLQRRLRAAAEAERERPQAARVLDVLSARAFLSDIKMPLDSGDFCLMDRRVVMALRSLPSGCAFRACFAPGSAFARSAWSTSASAAGGRIEVHVGQALSPGDRRHRRRQHPAAEDRAVLELSLRPGRAGADVGLRPDAARQAEPQLSHPFLLASLSDCEQQRADDAVSVRVQRIPRAGCTSRSRAARRTSSWSRSSASKHARSADVTDDCQPIPAHAHRVPDRRPDDRVSERVVRGQSEDHFWFQWRARAANALIERIGLPAGEPLTRVRYRLRNRHHLPAARRGTTKWIFDGADLNVEALSRCDHRAWDGSSTTTSSRSGRSFANGTTSPSCSTSSSTSRTPSRFSRRCSFI